MVGHAFLRQGQKPWYDAPEAPVDAFTLAAWEGELIDLHARCMVERDKVTPGLEVTGQPLTYAMGSQCKWCPSKLHCEAQTKLVRVMANKPVSLADFIKEGLTVATASQAISRLEVLQAAINTAWEALYAFASEHPTETEDGRWLRKGTKTRKVFVEDGEKSHTIAARVLSETVGPALAMQAFKMAASQKRVEEVARIIVKSDPEGAFKLCPAGTKKVSISAVKVGLLGRIEEAGGFTEVSKEVTDFFRTAAGNEVE
jgi:hypothetical protein